MNEDKSAQSISKNSVSKKPGGFGRFLLVLILMILGFGLGAVSWYVFEQNKALDVLFSQQNELSSQRSAASGNVETLEALITTIQSALDDTKNQIEQQQAELQQLGDQLVSVQLRASESSQEASQQVSGSGSSAYLLNEVEAMLRLAQQRLLLAKDVPTAIALMVASDEILRDMNDSAVYSVRDAIASDLASLRSVPEIDVQGLYVRLSALSQRVPDLLFNNGTEEQVASGEVLGKENEGFFSGVMSQLGKFITIRRLDAPLEPMVTAEQGYYIRQNIQLLLEQAQLALWRNQEAIYRNNLDQAITNIELYFSDNSNRASLLAGLRQLEQENISEAIPAANRGLNTTRQILQAYERGQLIQGPLTEGEE